MAWHFCEGENHNCAVNKLHEYFLTTLSVSNPTVSSIIEREMSEMSPLDSWKADRLIQWLGK